MRPAQAYCTVLRAAIQGMVAIGGYGAVGTAKEGNREKAYVRLRNALTGSRWA